MKYNRLVQLEIFKVNFNANEKLENIKSIFIPLYLIILLYYIKKISKTVLFKLLLFRIK